MLWPRRSLLWPIYRIHIFVTAAGLHLFHTSHVTRHMSHVMLKIVHSNQSRANSRTSQIHFPQKTSSNPLLVISRISKRRTAPLHPPMRWLDVPIATTGQKIFLLSSHTVYFSLRKYLFRWWEYIH